MSPHAWWMQSLAKRQKFLAPNHQWISLFKKTQPEQHITWSSLSLEVSIRPETTCHFLPKDRHRRLVSLQHKWNINKGLYSCTVFIKKVSFLDSISRHQRCTPIAKACENVRQLWKNLVLIKHAFIHSEKAIPKSTGTSSLKNNAKVMRYYKYISFNTAKYWIIHSYFTQHFSVLCIFYTYWSTVPLA